MSENKKPMHILSQDEVNKMLINHETRISRIEGSTKLLMSLMGLNISINIAIFIILIKLLGV